MARFTKSNHLARIEMQRSASRATARKTSRFNNFLAGLLSG
ncbi:hypothetical protein [Tropicimonas sp. IMCC6043]|nr:hypothetical protein [Tropicimonas sp. IMCC6043]